MRCDMKNRYFCVRLLLALGLFGPTVHAKADVAPEEAAPARISPVNGSAASTISPLVSPLLLTPLEATKLKAQILRALQTKAGVAIRLTAAPNGDRDTRWVTQQYEAIKEPRQKYWLVGQHLLMAEYLLQSHATDPRMTGMDIARIASRRIATDLGETRLAAQIIQAYLLPNYPLAEEAEWEALSRAGIATRLAEAYQEIQDDRKVSPGEKYQQRDDLIDAYRLQISVIKDEAKADYARWNIAKVLERSFRFEEAIRYLQEVNPRGTQLRARQEIPRLQALLEKQRRDAAKSAAHLAGEDTESKAPQDSQKSKTQSTN